MRITTAYTQFKLSINSYLFILTTELVIIITIKEQNDGI